jgi:transcriptional regulator with XRE-family HTH domain
MLTGRPLSVPEAPRRESIDSVLAKNLVAARVIAGFTQHELANAAGVSRATVAQLETGLSDPRLSTVVDLARALGVAPIVLLSGVEEVRALAKLVARPAGERLAVPPQELGRMREFVGTGMLKDRVRAARVGAAVARPVGVEGKNGVPVTAGVFSATLPGWGTVIGAELGRLLE